MHPSSKYQQYVYLLQFLIKNVDKVLYILSAWFFPQVKYFVNIGFFNYNFKIFKNFVEKIKTEGVLGGTRGGSRGTLRGWPTLKICHLRYILLLYFEYFEDIIIKFLIQ